MLRWVCGLPRINHQSCEYSLVKKRFISKNGVQKAVIHVRSVTHCKCFWLSLKKRFLRCRAISVTRSNQSSFYCHQTTRDSFSAEQVLSPMQRAIQMIVLSLASVDDHFKSWSGKSSIISLSLYKSVHLRTNSFNFFKYYAAAEVSHPTFLYI